MASFLALIAGDRGFITARFEGLLLTNWGRPLTTRVNAGQLSEALDERLLCFRINAGEQL
jgi:hypothetical protein